MISPRKIDVWAKGFQANLKSVFNPKKFERIQYEIRHDPQYNEMVKDGVRFNDMNSADPLLHNEDFRKSFIYKIPIISEPLKASNRSADAFLNTTRYEMYKKMRNNDSNLQTIHNSGHYTCWQRRTRGWIEISDTFATFHKEFIDGLENVYALFLEKI